MTHGLVRLFAEGIGRAGQFGMIYLAQRTLGPAAYGEFSVLMGIAFIASVAADFGLQMTAARQLAQNNIDPGGVAGHMLWVRAALAVGVGAVCMSLNAGRPILEQLSLALLLIGLMLAGLAETCGYILRGVGAVGRETSLLLAVRAATAVFGVAALLMSPTPLALGFAYVVAGAVAAAFGALQVKALIPDARFERPPAAEMRAMAVDAGPLGLATLMSIAYTRIPLFVLEAARGAADVAAYAVAQRLTEPLAIIPASLLAPVFPAYAAAIAAGRTGAARRIAVRHALLFGALGAGVAAIYLAGGPAVLAFLYPGGQYASAAAPLTWLALASVPAFVNLALTQFLVARRRTRLNAFFTAAQLALCAGLCVAVARGAGPEGPAQVIALCELLLLALCLLAR